MYTIFSLYSYARLLLLLLLLTIKCDSSHRVQHINTLAYKAYEVSAYACEGVARLLYNVALIIKLLSDTGALENVCVPSTEQSIHSIKVRI